MFILFQEMGDTRIVCKEVNCIYLNISSSYIIKLRKVFEYFLYSLLVLQITLSGLKSNYVI